MIFIRLRMILRTNHFDRDTERYDQILFKDTE